MKEDPEHQEMARRKEIFFTGTCKTKIGTLIEKTQLENKAGGYAISSGGEDALWSGSLVSFWLTLVCFYFIGSTVVPDAVMCNVCRVEKPHVLGEYPHVFHMHVVMHAMSWMPFKGKTKNAASNLSALHSVWDVCARFWPQKNISSWLFWWLAPKE